ncbi:hypothetical protein ACXYMO_06305 [Arenibacterium sp. CAU 1754]
MTALLGLIAGLGGALSTTDHDKLRNLTLWPIALLVVGVAVGASAGNFVRANDYLGRVGGPEAGSKRPEGADSTGLFTGTLEECIRLRGSAEDQLARNLRLSAEPWANRIEQAFADDTDAMRKAVEALCGS